MQKTKDIWKVVDEDGKVWATFRYRQIAIEKAKKLKKELYGKPFTVELIKKVL